MLVSETTQIMNPIAMDGPPVPRAALKERTLTIMWSKPIRTTCSALSKLRKKRSIGRRRMITIRLSLASATSITRKSLTIGGRPKTHRRMGFDPLFLTRFGRHSAVIRTRHALLRVRGGCRLARNGGERAKNLRRHGIIPALRKHAKDTTELVLHHPSDCFRGLSIPAWHFLNLR